MNIERVTKNGITVAVITGKDLVITDAQSALNLIMTANYEASTNLLAVDKNMITSDFF